ncbi:MAG TPA: hypothetical protein ENN36_03395 [Candidatus Bathyarchaeota archaeon]|nr:hypothetical protein [Candidatus Bathyarchaeota archaeon]
MLKKVDFSKFVFSRLFPHVIELSLVASAALVLSWVSWLTWIDVTEWGKGLGSIFFGSRAGEPISLGIGMTVMHYFLIGVSLLSAGLAMLLRNRILTVKPQFARLMGFLKVNVDQRLNAISAVKSAVKEETVAAREETLFVGCRYHFGYLSSRPEDSVIPQECMLCHRLGDCMVATVYAKNLGKDKEADYNRLTGEHF